MNENKKKKQSGNDHQIHFSLSLSLSLNPGNERFFLFRLFLCDCDSGVSVPASDAELFIFLMDAQPWRILTMEMNRNHPREQITQWNTNKNIDKTKENHQLSLMYGTRFQSGLLMVALPSDLTVLREWMTDI